MGGGSRGGSQSSGRKPQRWAVNFGTREADGSTRRPDNSPSTNRDHYKAPSQAESAHNRMIDRLRANRTKYVEAHGRVAESRMTFYDRAV